MSVIVRIGDFVMLLIMGLRTGRGDDLIRAGKIIRNNNWAIIVHKSEVLIRFRYDDVCDVLPLF